MAKRPLGGEMLPPATRLKHDNDDASSSNTYVHMPEESVLPWLPIRRILRRWGWQESNWLQNWEGNTFVGKADLYWSQDASIVTRYPMPNVKVVNHIDGACYLCNKLAIGWCLDRSPEAASYFWPRQYNLHYKDQLNAFLDDHAVCEMAVRQGKLGGQQDPNSRQRVLEGPTNAWVVKGTQGDLMGNNGLAVAVYTKLEHMLAECEQYEWEAVIQKYLERPLLVPQVPGGEAAHKVDLRMWVFILDKDPMIVLAHPDAYFRVSTKRYELKTSDIPDPYAHKTNWRDEENRVTLRVLLERMGPEVAALWERRTWPMMMDAVRAAFIASKELSFGPAVHGRERRGVNQGVPNAFELFGFDFCLDDEWRPWLLEVNRSPAMLDDCWIDDLWNFAESATETMISTSLAYYKGELEVPTPEQLQYASGKYVPDTERLFPDSMRTPKSTRPGGCYGEAVMQTPESLVHGLSLGGPTDKWLLCMRLPKSDPTTDIQLCQQVWAEWNGAIEVDRYSILRSRPSPTPMAVHFKWCHCPQVNQKMSAFTALLKTKLGKSVTVAESTHNVCWFEEVLKVTCMSEVLYSSGNVNFDKGKGKSKGKFQGKGKAIDMWQQQMWGADAACWGIESRPTHEELRLLFNQIAWKCCVETFVTDEELWKCSWTQSTWGWTA
eukprot:TRINITY_DN17529_c0_g1_i1.p1 TRINITY_DN17529_c0_g1~~TRINITY_DN17529_c0_g1_i1.p1  ORF type:complete len:663 (+),score=153.11 TRINITY_DN17529_c0_g1_i1:89-2077(+)